MLKALLGIGVALVSIEIHRLWWKSAVSIDAAVHIRS